MARLTKKQKESLAEAAGSDLMEAIVECILRLDEEVASEDGHEATIGRLSEDLRAARAARADLFSALSRVEASRDEARTMLGQLQSAYSAAVSVVVKTGHHRTTPVLAEAVSLIVAERDEARAKLAEAWCERDEARAKLAEAERQRDEALAVRANQEATIEDLSEVLASAIDERDELRDVRDELWAKLENACSERDGARAKLADVDRLLAIEEQAKRVARAERWHEWACLAHLDAHLSARTRTEDLRDALIALNEASDALDAECHKLAEMVGEGDET
jgi:chromosome segregation ATPase